MAPSYQPYVIYIVFLNPAQSRSSISILQGRKEGRRERGGGGEKKGRKKRKKKGGSKHLLIMSTKLLDKGVSLRSYFTNDQVWFT